MQIEMLRNAEVKTTASMSKDSPQAVITVNGEHIHAFPVASPYSRALNVVKPADLDKRLNGGHFFFVNNELVKFQENDYAGFIHSDEAIGKLSDILGVERRKNKYVLGKTWSKNDFTIGAFAGGEFNTGIKFLWDPFAPSIDTDFQILRLICLNGMMANRTLFNSRIPMVNCWEEHMEIASRQLQNKVSSLVKRRLAAMVNERASVDELMAIESHARRRIAGSEEITEKETQALRNIAKAASPVAHLGHVYKDEVFTNKHLARQMPSHLTAFDTFNMVTEIQTHTPQTEDSTSRALNQMANVLLFERKATGVHAPKAYMPAISPFSSADRAFFGELDLAA